MEGRGTPRPGSGDRLDAAKVTAPWQRLDEIPDLSLDFAGEPIRFERTPYPSSGCFFPNEAQLGLWASSEGFLDGDVSYLSALDSAAALSVMKRFRVYKPVLRQAWFLEVAHASPRWGRLR